MTKTFTIIIVFVLSIFLVSCGKISKYYDNKGDTLLNEEKYRESIKFYNKALIYNRKNKEALHSLGRAYDNMGDFNIAIEYYSKSLDVDSLFALAYRSRGYARYKIQDYNNALEDYLISLDIDSCNATAYRNTGSIYKELCEYNKAREYIYASLKYEAYHWGIIDLLSTIEFDLGNYDSCISHCYKVIGHLTENQDSPYGTLGLVYNAIGLWDSSVMNLNRAIKINPGFASYYNNLGYSLIELSRYSDALKNYNIAIELDSLTPSFFTNKADLLYEIGKYHEAIENYNKSIELSKLYEGYSCGVCYNNRAWARKKIGDIKGYKEDIKIARQIGFPDNYKRYSNLESCFYKEDR